MIEFIFDVRAQVFFCTSQKINESAARHGCVGIGIDVESRVTDYVSNENTLVKFG